MKHLTPTDREILHIAVPAIVTNITVPLLGLADLAITGHMGSAAYVGAIAVGGMMFNIIYWVFGFLRMGTSGLTSQAFGRGDTAECSRLLARSLLVALAVALCLLLGQQPLLHMAMAVIGVEPGLQPLVSTYFHVCIWGAPAMLCLYGLTGWYIGMQNTRITMTVSIVQNVVNIGASVLLVYVGGLDINGVAMGTVVAQYTGVLVALAYLRRHHRRTFPGWQGAEVFRCDALAKFFIVNRDIFLRTLFLVGVNLFFVSAGARQGMVMLSVNTLLMQLFTLFSYIMDGFAFAGEALCGKHKGAGNAIAFHTTVRHLFGWGIALALLYTAVYALGGQAFLSLLTNDTHILHAAVPYLPWAVAIPLTGMAAFVLDGIFIGLTRTRGMLVSALVSALVFALAYVCTFGTLHNHGLWLAFILYLSTRGLVQGALFIFKT